MKRYLFLLALPIAARTAPLSAQARHCVKGIPCGGACISARYTCHVGVDTTRAVKVQSPAMAAKDTFRGSDSVWVASAADSVYFFAVCDAAKDVAPANRRYFKTEQLAKDAGFRRSRVKGC